MAKRSAARDKAVEVCRQFPDVPSRTLARQLRRDEPKLFASVEHARDHVRLIRGANGKKRRHQADSPQPLRKAGEVVLPKGMRQGLKPIHVPPGKDLIINDIHTPYHDERALKIAVEYGLKEGCDSLYINGDFHDFYAISRWQKDPRQRDLPNELKTGQEVLKAIGAPFKRKFFKAGNHEDRWNAFIWQRAEELVGVEGFSLQEVLKLEQLGFQFVDSKQWAWMGKLPILHGHEFPSGISSPVNPARGLWNRLSDTAMCGHLHRSSHHSETHSMTKQSISCWSVACLCDLSPSFSPLNKWNWGFATVEHDKRSFQVSNYKIDNKTFEIWRA